MKNLGTILGALAFAGVLILFGLRFSGGKNASSGAGNTVSAPVVNGNGRIAYVDIDTLEENYEYLKNKKDEFKKRQVDVDAELQRTAAAIQKDYEALQKKAQAGTLGQAEGEAAQRSILQRQQNFESRKQSLSEQLLKEQDAFNKDLQNRLDKYLGEYNKDKHYDYILSYSKGGSILLCNKELNITEEVIKGMNETLNDDGGSKKNK